MIHIYDAGVTFQLMCVNIILFDHFKIWNTIMTDYRKWNPLVEMYIFQPSEANIYDDCKRNAEIIYLKGKPLKTLLEEKGFHFPEMLESNPQVIEQAKKEFIPIFRTILEETLLDEVNGSVDKKTLAELISKLFGQKGIAYFGPTSISRQLTHADLIPEMAYTVNWNVDNQGYLTVTTNTKVTHLQCTRGARVFPKDENNPYAATTSRATLQFDLPEIKIKKTPVLVNVLSTPYPKIEAFFNQTPHVITIQSEADCDIKNDPLFFYAPEKGKTLEPIASLAERQLIEAIEPITTLNNILVEYRNHLLKSNTALSQNKREIINSAISALNFPDRTESQKLETALTILHINRPILEENQSKRDSGFLNRIKMFLINRLGIKSEGQKVIEKVNTFEKNAYQFFKEIQSQSSKEDEPQNKANPSMKHGK